MHNEAGVQSKVLKGTYCEHPMRFKVNVHKDVNHERVKKVIGIVSHHVVQNSYAHEIGPHHVMFLCKIIP